MKYVSSFLPSKSKVHHRNLFFVFKKNAYSDEGKVIRCLSSSLSETSSYQLEKPVCIGDLVIFENVVEEDLAKPNSTFFVNPVKENGPLIFLPSNSTFSEIKNQALEEQTKGLEGIILAEQSKKKATKSKQKKKQPIILESVCNGCTVLRNKVDVLQSKVANLTLDNQVLKNKVDVLQSKVANLTLDNQVLKNDVSALTITVSNLQRLFTTMVGTEEDAAFTKSVNTAKIACQNLGSLLRQVFQREKWKHNLNDLKEGLEKNQIVVSPLTSVSLDELKNGLELFDYWLANRKLINSIAHLTFKVEEIRKDPQHVLYPFLDILEKVLKDA